ncbi:MAG: hypothetical protein V7637_5218 [Mycobacteriales bacterium]
MSGVQTFVVRLWTPAAPDGGLPHLNGLVEHVGSGRRETFSGGPEMLEFITDCLREQWPRPPSAGVDDPGELPGSRLGGSGG